jgi:hypothetical protein
MFSRLSVSEAKSKVVDQRRCDTLQLLVGEDNLSVVDSVISIGD